MCELMNDVVSPYCCDAECEGTVVDDRSDAAYVSDWQLFDGYQFLRLCPDGTVMHQSVVAGDDDDDEEVDMLALWRQVGGWFKPGYQAPERGEYEIDEGKIRFALGVAKKYVGTFQGDRLILSRETKNGLEPEVEYRRLRLDVLD